MRRVGQRSCLVRKSVEKNRAGKRVEGIESENNIGQSKKQSRKLLQESKGLDDTGDQY